VNSVLLIRLSAMGDLVQSLGSVASLREVRPDCRVTVVTQREWAPLLEGVDGIDRVVRFDRRGGLRALWSLRRELRRERVAAALDLQGNWKSALVARLAAAKERVGMARDWRQEPGSRLLLQRTVECDAPPHPARAAWELIKQVAPEAPFRHPALVATEAEVEAERSALEQLGVDCAAPFRVVVVTRPEDPRCLSPQWLRELRQEGTPMVSLLGPGEDDLAPPEGHVLRHPSGQVRRLVALGALVARAKGEVVGPDQGPTHVLLASSARGRVFFGSQDPRRTAPPSAQAFVRTGELACRPCRKRSCSNVDGPVCMNLTAATAEPVELGLPPIGATGPGPWPDDLD